MLPRAQSHPTILWSIGPLSVSATGKETSAQRSCGLADAAPAVRSAAIPTALPRRRERTRMRNAAPRAGTLDSTFIGSPFSKEGASQVTVLLMTSIRSLLQLQSSDLDDDLEAR